MPGPPEINLYPPRPAWGIQVPTRKSLSTARPILQARLPAAVTLSLWQPAGNAQPLVQAGDQVSTGQPVGWPESRLVAPVHASIAGEVVAVGEHQVAGVPGGPVPCVVIRSDGSDRRWPGLAPCDPAEMTPAALRDRIHAGGIVGLGGALFPTAAKLATIGAGGLLIINGVECEPYISCDEMLMQERPHEVLAGTQLLLAATGMQQAVIAIKNNMTAARIALSDALDALADPRLKLAQVTARYPAGGERQLIEMITGREVPAGGLPADIGCVCQNVATAAAVARLFRDGEPLISRIVTVTGGAISTPVNIEARLGTAIAELISQAGGYREDPERLIMGGPMMGEALTDDRLPLGAATNCIIASRPGELVAAPAELPCIRCGACMEACPARLLPQELLVACRQQDSAALNKYALTACIECGACDYVCPSHIRLTDAFVAGKMALASQQQRTQQAARARQRHEARSARLARDEQARVGALSAREQALDQTAASTEALRTLLGQNQRDS